MPSNTGQSISVGCEALKIFVLDRSLALKTSCNESLPPGWVGPSHTQVGAFGLIVLRPVRVADHGSWDALDERTPKEEVKEPPDNL